MHLRSLARASIAALALVGCVPSLAVVGGVVGGPLPQGLTTRIPFGSAGTLHIVIPHGYRSGKGASLTAVLWNDGAEDLPLRSSDYFGVRTSRGRIARLETDQAWPARLPSNRFLRMTWRAKKGIDVPDGVPIFHCAALGADHGVDTKVEMPRRVLEAAPAYPLDLRQVTGSKGGHFVAVVGEDGSVERVLDPAEPTDDMALTFRTAVHDALAGSRFEPARVEGQPRRTVSDEYYSIRGANALRASFSLPPDAMVKRLREYLSSRFRPVLELPDRDGYFVVFETKPDQSSTVRATVVRTGSIPGGSGSWLAVATEEVSMHVGDNLCRCVVAGRPVGGEEGFLTAFEKEIGTRSTLVVALGGGLLPSGYAESPETSGRASDLILERAAAILEGSYRTAEAPDFEPVPADESIADLKGEVVAPQLVVKKSPSYPEFARRARVTGKVIVQAVIDKKGRVVDPTVLRGHPILDQAAIDAVCCWRYRPATLRGKPVAVYFTVVVSFTLR